MKIEDLKKNAEDGSIVDQTILGICYLEGLGTAQNYTQAFRWLSLAAERGAPRAEANLGLMYRDGLGTDPNIHSAIALFERAADAGEFLPHIWLARIFNADGNNDKAKHWYVRALTFEDKVDADEEIAEAKLFCSKQL